MIYSICYGNERASLSLSGVHIYITIRKLLDPIFYILLVSICWWESQIHLHRLFPQLVAYTICTIVHNLYNFNVTDVVQSWNISTFYNFNVNF
jgi:hypothetical protein